MRYSRKGDEMKSKWIKVVCEIAKYALGAILGAVGTAASGCCFVPVA